MRKGFNFRKKILSAIEPAKATGRIETSSKERPSLLFFGRTIKRRGREISFVDPSYLSDTFKDFGITSGASTTAEMDFHRFNKSSENPSLGCVNICLII